MRRNRTPWIGRHWARFFLLAMTVALCKARAQDSSHSVVARFNLSSEARIYINPLSPDPVERDLSNNFGSFYSFAFAYTFDFTNQTHIQIGIEFIPEQTLQDRSSGVLTTDGFEVQCAELAGLFSLPFGSNIFQLYVGGGLGVYHGVRKYSVAGIPSTSVQSLAAAGIITLVGAQFKLTSHLGLQAEMRFRDPQMTVKNAFDRESVLIDGNEYHLGTQPFTSKINLNGNVYSIGVLYSL